VEHTLAPEGGLVQRGNLGEKEVDELQRADDERGVVFRRQDGRREARDGNELQK
jgi:hypothetical protein